MNNTQIEKTEEKFMKKDFFDGSGNPLKIILEEVAKDTINLLKSETTSTDIEDLKKEKTIRLRIKEKLSALWKQETGVDSAYLSIKKDFNELFAPHLSNKSELKKEAVREFSEVISDRLHNRFRGKENSALFRTILDFEIEGYLEEYLSSDEKNSKLGGKE